MNAKVKKKIVVEGDLNKRPTKGARVKCHYTLTLKNGKVIDCSRKRSTFLIFFTLILD